MKRRLLPLLLLPCLLLSGCWQDTSLTEEEPFDQNAVISSQEEESLPLPTELALPWYNGVTLDPITCPDGAQQTVAALLYEGLFELDQSFTPQPRLCASAASSEDATVWTLTLDSSAHFSDGSSVRPRDVAASLQRARESDRYRGRLAAVTAITEGRGTVTIRLSRGNADLPALLDIPIVKSGTQDAAVPTGSGPYTLVRSESGSYLSADPSWWRGSHQPAERIALVDCSDESSVQYQFSSHAVQLLVSDQTGSSPIRTGSHLESTEADTTVLHYLLFNCQNSLLSDAAVRRCLGLGIDRKSLVSACFSGHGKAAQFPLSPASALYPADIAEDYRYEAFEDALDSSGLNTGEQRQLTLLVNGDSKFKTSAASYLAAALSVCDLSITVRALPWAEYCAALEKGDFDICYASVKLSADWDLTALLAPDGALNYGGFQDETITRQLAAALAAQDRAGAMVTLCRLLRQQAPIQPLCFESRSVLTQEGVFEGLLPTAADPFYGIGTWQLHLAESGA